MGGSGLHLSKTQMGTSSSFCSSRNGTRNISLFLEEKRQPQVARAFDTMGQQVYYTMSGPSEFHVVGIIKDWDRTNRLHEIKVPTLITSGFYDESTPLINETMHNEIASSEWVLFEHSSHMAHIEEMELYMQAMRDFLHRVENAAH